MKTINCPISESEAKFIKDSLLEQQETIVYPTETFYALGCAATKKRAVEKIYSLKKRDTNLPLLVLVDSWDMLQDYAQGITGTTREFLENYWPGALTAILNTRQNKLAPELNTMGSKIGFRMTSSEIARSIIRAAGVPLVGTSANFSSKPEASTCETAKNYFGDQVDIYINGGETPGGMASTLIDLTMDKIKVVRQGAIQISR